MGLISVRQKGGLVRHGARRRRLHASLLRRRRARPRRRSLVTGYLPEEEEEEVYSYSSDAVEGPRAPAVKLTARHSSLTRVRAAVPPREREREKESATY